MATTGGTQLASRTERNERHQVSSNPSFRGVLKDVTRERCGSQGTPFRRVLSTTINGHDTTAKLETYQSFVAGGLAGLRSSFRSVLKDVTRERCGSQGTLFRRVLSTTISGHGTTAKLETYQSFAAGGHRNQTEIFLPGCIEGCHARTVRLPRDTIP